MILTNRCNLPAAWTMGFRRDGRELLIVIVKATFTLPAPGEVPTLLEDQVPLFTLLGAKRIGVSLSDEFQIHPEQSTSAIVVHHPQAKYFSV